jgi:hypothetical protein
MNIITGKVICAGKLKDNNYDEYHGLMIETGEKELSNKAIPFYHLCAIIPFLSTAEQVREWLLTGISNQQYKKLAEILAADIAKEKNS